MIGYAPRLLTEIIKALRPVRLPRPDQRRRACGWLISGGEDRTEARLELHIIHRLRLKNVYQIRTVQRFDITPAQMLQPPDFIAKGGMALVFDLKLMIGDKPRFVDDHLPIRCNHHCGMATRAVEQGQVIAHMVRQAAQRLNRLTHIGACFQHITHNERNTEAFAHHFAPAIGQRNRKTVLIDPVREAQQPLDHPDHLPPGPVGAQQCRPAQTRIKVVIRTLTSQGVEVLLHPVLTGTTDRDAELAIARATAAQFRCYIIDINGLGAGGVGRSCIVDPTSMVLHQSAGQEDMFPIEIDLDQVRRQRETGLKGLGQVLKSFRDRSTDYSIYDRSSGTDAYLHQLGPLETPKQGARGGLDAPGPGAALNKTTLQPELDSTNIAPLTGVYVRVRSLMAATRRPAPTKPLLLRGHQAQSS